MIKCILSGKSLKQLFIIGLISCFILLGNSFVSASYCGTYGSNGYNILTYTNTDTNFISNSEDSDYFRVSNNLNFLTNGTYNLLYHRYNGDIPGYASVFWNNNKLYLYNSDNNINNALGYVDNFIVCDAFTGGSSACNFYDSCQFSSNSRITMSYSDFLSDYNHGNADMVGMQFYYGDLQIFCLSYSSLGYSLCVNMSDYIGNIVYDTGYWVGLQSNINDYPFMSHLNYSPFGGSSNNSGGNIVITDPNGPEDYNYTELTGDDLVNYFENNPFYKFDRNICYVGTDDLNVLYGYGGSFTEGAGKTVFDLYGAIYGSGLNNSFKTNQVGAFINTWWINYNTWFDGLNRDEDGNVMYNAIYNVSGVSLDYSDNLTNPFLNNRLAIYFMASEMTSYGNVSTPGEEIAVYCYHKFKQDGISFGDFDITDEHSQAFDNNASDFIDNWNRYSYKSGSINIESQSWDGTILDNYTGDDNLDFSTFFSKSFNKWKNTFNISNEDLGAGFLPTYIILFLMAIIIFRFLSH